MIGAAIFALAGALFAQIIESDPDMLRELEANSIAPDLVRLVLFVMAAVAICMGGATAILAFFVRKGSHAASLAAIILTALAIVFELIIGVAVMVDDSSPAVSKSDPAADIAVYLLMGVVPMVLLCLLLTWLIQAIRAHGVHAQR